MKRNSLHDIVGSPLARRLLRDLALFGLVAVVALTALRLALDYRQIRAELDSELDDVKNAYLAPLTQSLWTTNDKEVTLQLHGIVQSPFLEHALVVEAGKTVAESGRRASTHVVERTYPLQHVQAGQPHALGTLTVVASLDTVYARLRDDAVLILATNIAAVFSLAIITFLLFYRLVTRHLLTTTNYLRNFDILNDSPALALARRAPAKTDELDELVAALNAMQTNTREILLQLHASEERMRFALQGANDGLWDWDLKTNRTHFSPRWKAMLGYADHELENVFATWERLVHPQDRANALFVLQEYLANRREKYEIEKMPTVEKAEVKEIYAAKGFKGKILNDIVKHITSNNEQWLKFMMKEELELTELKNKDIYIGSFVVGFSALVGSFVPITPFFFLPLKSAVICSLIVSAVVLMFIGIYKAKATIGNPFKTGIQMVIIGMSAALAGYYIGHFFGQ